MPVIFKLLVVLLAVLAAAFILVPALRKFRGQSPRHLGLPVFMVVIAVGGALSLYAMNSDWNWATNGVPEDPAMRALYDMRKAVHDEPQNMSAWNQLGTFYLRYGQINGAIEALGTAFELSRGQNTGINLSLVEALAMAGDPAQMARAAEVIDVTLQRAPTDRKALWYGGEIARTLGNNEVARERWQTLLDSTAQETTPEAQSVARMLRERIASIDTAIIDRGTTPPAKSSSATAASPETLHVSVGIAKKWQEQVAGDTIVFVLARAVGQPGPPLAVQRLTVRELPAEITLSDRNAMLPTRKLSGFKEVEVVARVSFDGTPSARPGDYFGALQVSDDDPRTLSITIDKVQP